MTRARTWLGGLAAFLVLALFAIWQVPQWLDWTRYRSTIEVLASATLGQPVSIQGPISLRILPQPVLTAAKVHVGGGGPADLSFQVEALRLRIAVLPLIGGRVDARELVLRGPDLHIPWPTERGMLRSHPPKWLAAFSARIEDGRLSIGRLAFTGVDARLATLSTGALTGSGQARFNGQDWHFTARLTAAGADGAAGLNFTLDGQGGANGLGVSFTGQWAPDGTLAGNIDSRGPNLAALLPAPAVPFRADGRLTVGSGLMAVDDLALEIGGSPATGAVALRVAPQQRLDVALSASRLDLNAWLPVLLHTSSSVAGMPLPLSLDFSIEAAPLGGGTLEHMRAAFDLLGQDLIVREASARLPGNGVLQLTGRVARGDPSNPRFEGDAKLHAPVLRTTLQWLQETLPGALPVALLTRLPEGTLQRAELSAHVVAAKGEFALRAINGSVDDVPVAGAVGYKLGDPPAITADLSLERLPLDAWLPAQPSDFRDLSRRAAGLDAELRLNVGQASVAGIAVRGFVLDAAIEAGSILMRRMEGNVRGAHVVASGMLGTGGTLDDAKISIDAKNAAALGEMLPWHGTQALWQGPAQFELQASGTQAALAVTAQWTMADARLEANSTIDLDARKWNATLTVRHPGARRFLATLGVAELIGVPQGTLLPRVDDGSFALIAHLTGAPGEIGIEKLDASLATLHATGDLLLDGIGAEPHVTGHLYADALTLALPNTQSDVPLPLGVLHGWRGDLQIGIGRVRAGPDIEFRDMTAAVSLADDRLTLDRLVAKLGSGTVSAALQVNAANDPPSFFFAGSVSDAGIANPPADAGIDLLSGQASARVEVEASGYSPAAIVATMQGNASLAVTDGMMSGFDLFRLKQAVEKAEPRSAQALVSDALRTGTTGFDRLTVHGAIAHGDMLLDQGELIGAAGEARLTGAVHLGSQTLDVSIMMEPAVASPPTIPLRLSGPIDRPQRTPELAGLARWMAELVR